MTLKIVFDVEDDDGIQQVIVSENSTGEYIDHLIYSANTRVLADIIAVDLTFDEGTKKGLDTDPYFLSPPNEKRAYMKELGDSLSQTQPYFFPQSICYFNRTT